jgi:hypothetical protein
MKPKLSKALSRLAFLIVALAAADCARAGFITGSINFDGVASTNTGNLGSATAYTAITMTSTVPGATGDYAGVPIFLPVSFTPFAFSAPSVAPLWVFDSGGSTYAFVATTIDVAFQDSLFLNVHGFGLAYISSITGTPYNPLDTSGWTPGVWSITDTSVGSGPVFTFGSDALETGAVPDRGATAMLIALGLAMIGIGMVLRLRRSAAS